MRHFTLLGFLSVWALTSCTGSYSPPANSNPTPIVPSETDPNRDFGRQGRGNASASQLYESMKRLTGITSHQGIESYFVAQEPTLPQFNQASKISASHFNAIANLATQFCLVLINEATHRDRFFAGTPLLPFNTSKTPANLFSSEMQKRDWAEFFLRSFVVSAELDLDHHSQDLNTLVDLINGLLAELPTLTNSAESGNPRLTDSQRILINLCVATLASTRLSLN